MKLVLIGLVAGLLSGLLGVGGGIFIVPMLVLIAGFSQHGAHATSLAAVVPIAAAGALFYGGESNVDIGAALLLATGAVVGAPLGAKVMAGMAESTLKVVFGILLVGLGLFMVIR